MGDLSLNYLLTGTDKSASKTMENTATVGQKVASNIGGAFSKMGSTVGGELGELLNRVGEGIEHLGERSLTTGQKMSAVGAGIAGIGIALSTLGSKDQAAEQQLSTAFANAGTSVEEYKSQIEEAVAKQEGFGTSAANTKNALTTLATATGDPAKALKDLGTVADYAAVKHISLNDAADALSKALSGGSTKAFTGMGIHIKTNADGTKDLTGAMDELAKKTAGQASAATDTFSGKLKGVYTNVMDNVEALGAKYGPAITAVGGVMTGFGAILQIVATAQGVYAAAQASASVAEDVGTASTWALNTAWYANPIVWIVAAIVLAIGILIAAIVLIWQNWDQISGWIVGVWNNNVLPFFKFVGDFFVGIFKAIGAFAAKIWQDITTAFTNAWNGIVAFFRGIINDGIISPLESAMNWVIDLINGVTSAINLVSGIFGVAKIPTLQHVHIARLAQGAIVTGSAAGVPVIAGDGGKSEIVTNKSQMSSFVADAVKGGGVGGVTDLSQKTMETLGAIIARNIRNGGRNGGPVSA